MREFIGEDFLLSNETAKELYHGHAKDMPIFDYHCHLSEKAIQEDKPFNDFFELWLGGDHYKWRLMRNFGIDEEYITGGAPHKEKFMCYVRALETAYGNPLYHWSHMELRNYFGIDDVICSANAEKIWDKANDYIKTHSLSPSSLIAGSNVKIVCTTNEIFDDLTVFDDIKKKNYPFRVLPTFRADKVMNIDDPRYIEYLGRLCSIYGDIPSLEELEKAIAARIVEFKEKGAVAADIALQKVYPPCAREKTAEAFGCAVSGKQVTEAQAEAYKSFVMGQVLRGCAANGLAVQVHVGAMRNNNSRMYKILGADTGYDSIDDGASIAALSRWMDALDAEGSLPKMVLFQPQSRMEPAAHHAGGVLSGFERARQDPVRSRLVVFGSPRRHPRPARFACRYGAHRHLYWNAYGQPQFSFLSEASLFPPHFVRLARAQGGKRRDLPRHGNARQSGPGYFL